MVKANVAVAIPDLVGESFDLFGDRGHSAIVAKEAGGVTVMGGGEILEPFPGVGGFDWRISRIEVGGLDGSLGVVEACFPWGMFVLVRPCAAEGVRDRDQVQGGGGAVFFTAGWTPLSVVPGASSIWMKVHGYSPWRS